MKSLSVVISLVVLVGGLTYFRSSSPDAGGLRLSGVVSANEVIVSAKIDGRIQRLHVNEGSWVARNDLIAELGREEIEPDRQRQQAAVQQQEAKLSQSREQLRLDRDRVRTQFAGAQAQLQLAHSQREEARTELGQLQRDFERSSGLVQQGLLARQEAEKVETSLRVAEARIRSLDDRVRVAQADLELSRANERQVAVTAQDVEQIRAQLEQARAQLAQITARLGYTEVRAPLSGVVSLRVARQGEVIRQGDPIVTIIDLDDVWVRADVEESYMNRVVVGQVLPVRLASGEELQGQVSFVSPETEFATQRDVNRTKRDIRTFGIKVALSNAERRLHPGMTAYVLLPGSVPPAVALDARKDAGRPAAAATSAPVPRPVVEPAAPPVVSKVAAAVAIVPAIAKSPAPALEKPAPAPAAAPTPIGPAPAALAPVPLLAKATPAAVPAAKAPEPVPAPPVARPAPAGLPRLSLEAISVIKGKPVAVINRQRLVPGETIAGARVIRILDYQVELEYQGRRFAIGL